MHLDTEDRLVVRDATKFFYEHRAAHASSQAKRSIALLGLVFGFVFLVEFAITIQQPKTTRSVVFGSTAVLFTALGRMLLYRSQRRQTYNKGMVEKSMQEIEAADMSDAERQLLVDLCMAFLLCKKDKLTSTLEPMGLWPRLTELRFVQDLASDYG